MADVVPLHFIEFFLRVRFLGSTNASVGLRRATSVVLTKDYLREVHRDKNHPLLMHHFSKKALNRIDPMIPIDSSLIVEEMSMLHARRCP